MTTRSSPTTPTSMPDPAWKGLYGVGGISGLLAGILGLVVVVVVLIEGGAPPSNTEAALKFVVQVAPLQGAAVLLEALLDFLFIPIALALYFTLGNVRKTSMLLATALFGTFAIFDLGVDVVNFYSLAILAGKFTAATSDVQRAAYVVAADLANAQTGAGFLLHGIPLAIAITIAGSVMLKGIFGKRAAFLGIVAGVVGVVAYPLTAISGIGLPLLMFGILTSIWSLMVGFKLYRLR